MDFKNYLITELTNAAIKKAVDKFVKLGEDEQEVSNIVNTFNDLINSKKIKAVDIFSIKSFDELKNIVGNASKTKSRSEKQKILRDKETEFIFENDLVLVVSPKTHQASCKYGSQTRWCTTYHDSNYWDQYYQKGIKMYYIIPKDGSDKTAFAVYPNEKMEAFNAEDDSLDNNEMDIVLKQYNISKDILKPLDEEEINQRKALTEKQLDDVVRYFLTSILKPTDDEYENAYNVAKGTIEDRYNDEYLEYIGDSTMEDTIRNDSEDWSYYIEEALKKLEKKYGIDSDNIKNKIILIPEVIYSGDDMEYNIENDNEPFDKEGIKNFGFVYLKDKYNEMSLKDLVDDIELDFTEEDGMEKAQMDAIEDWLTYEINNKPENLRTFYDEMIEISKSNNDYGTNQISDTVKEQLKELLDKVKKVEYGKQTDEPKLDLESFKAYLFKKLV